jgi:FlaA1/EpsC-like NDP-sugar epimerase
MKSVRLSFVLSVTAALVGSLWLGYLVRFNFTVPPDAGTTLPLVCAWVVALKLFCLWRFRQFDAYLDYFNLPDFSKLFWMLAVPSAVVFGIASQFGSDYAPPRGVVVADFSFSVLALAPCACCSVTCKATSPLRPGRGRTVRPGNARGGRASSARDWSAPRWRRSFRRAGNWGCRPWRSSMMTA